MPDQIDVLVLGAGPAGMAAALQLQALGLEVRVLDEQRSPGGQIYREISRVPSARKKLLGADYAAGGTTVTEFLASGIDYVANASVWLISAEREVHYHVAGQAHVVQARRILLCGGAYERPMPIPGWTLPGVMTAGAGQILLKSAGQVPIGPVVLAGSGPLLYLLAAQYLQAGVRVSALVDTCTRRDLLAALRWLPAALKGWRQLRKGIALMHSLKRAGVAWYRGASDLRIEGREQAEALTFQARGHTQRIACELILLHQGVVPNTQPSLSMAAAHRWDDSQMCWVAEQDEWGQLSVPGCFIAGDAAGIDGAEAAAVQGRVVALGIALSLQRLSAHAARQQARPWRRLLDKYRSVRPFLERLYRPQPSLCLPADETIVCRCEEVTAGAIREYAALGCLGPNQTKAFGRCGMGPCQGRQCGLAVTQILADAHQVTPAQVGYYRIRPPLKPITLAELASQD
ncbi:NAD(P)/FAD-dependent oxidoreductase [Pseudomonas gingeri]|uniref:FAD/NAD(P)-dependent oxidoreductase n=1 Tax=Pseudomonas gingeri TaxID=117681 RepID=UPI0015A3DBBC|nr:NAD(P)/FAD-dependent oxidoreductase [Pseudomonas gingeri]NWD04871.1 FAD-dependent oxidoreductase [Pseudomonas gingeri]NWE30763.1 FAD-dependent oxidoreductase [Pseudomonas gingeri]NWE58825.1 FAD-dependent oxidoreductase [Pseudomonas gingeri]NWF02587.1 FAD-dependent oxidoreductase [Pseudomonas gingeri]